MKGIVRIYFDKEYEELKWKLSSGIATKIVSKHSFFAYEVLSWSLDEFIEDLEQLLELLKEYRESLRT